MAVIGLAAASSGLALAAIVLAARLAPRGPVAFLVAIGLLGWAMVDVTVGTAGLVVRDLSPGTLFVLAAAWTALAAALLRRSSTRQRLRQHLRAVRTAAADALAWPPAAIGAGLVALTLAWRLFLILRLPVVDLLGWQYHLVTVDVWLQSNALVPVTQTWWSQGYPADGELVTTWLAAFTRSDALTGFTGLLPIPLGILAVAGLARSLGAGRGPSLLAGLLFGMTPAMVALAGTTYVDAASVAALASAWWLGLRVLRGEREWSSVLVFGVAAGLALGTKDSNVILASPIVVAVGFVLVGSVVRPGSAPGAARATLAALLAYVLPILVLGASWYLKNLVLYGNPAFPFAVGPFAGPVTAAGSLSTPTPPSLEGRGFIDQVARSWVNDWRIWAYPYNVRSGGFGRAWPLLAVLGMGGLALLARRRDLLAGGLVVLPAAVTFVAAPDAWYARLTLFVLVVALPLAALALERLVPRLRSAAALAVLVAAALSLAVANLAPNVAVPLSGSRVARAAGYVAFVLGASDQARSDIDLRHACAGAAVIPPGARVAVARQYFFAHAIAGPTFDRILTSPVADESTPASLARGLEARNAGWLVVEAGSPLATLAASDPAQFVPAGPVCRGEIFRYVGPAS